jgi:hypothetical protein
MLASSYQKQIQLHSDHENATMKEEIETAKKMELEGSYVDASEARQAAKKVRLAKQTRKESFEARTAVDIRKTQDIEDGLTEERRIAAQSADMTIQRDERDDRDKQRRQDKVNRSQRLVEATARATREAKAREAQRPEISPSGYLQRTEAARKAKDDERLAASRQRNRDYNESVRLRDVRPQDRVDDPDFLNTDEDAVKEAETRMKILNMKRLRDYQKRQADERREHERQETLARLSESTDGDTMYFLKDNEW